MMMLLLLCRQRQRSVQPRRLLREWHRCGQGCRTGRHVVRTVGGAGYYMHTHQIVVVNTLHRIQFRSLRSLSLSVFYLNTFGASHIYMHVCVLLFGVCYIGNQSIHRIQFRTVSPHSIHSYCVPTHADPSVVSYRHSSVSLHLCGVTLLLCVCVVFSHHFRYDVT